MTEKQIKEMLNGIINNGEKWECRPKGYYCSEEQKYVDKQCDYDACGHTCRDDCYDDWHPYKLGDEIHKDWEYRKEEHTKKTWLEEYLDFNCDSKIEAHNFKIDIKNVCKKIMEELPKYLSESLYCEVVGNLRLVFKDLGIEL